MNCVIIVQELGYIMLLLRGLNDLCHELFETLMVSKDDEVVTQEIVTPFHNIEVIVCNSQT